MLVNLANGIAAIGVDVDFVVSDIDKPYLSQLAPSIRLVRLQPDLVENTVEYLSSVTHDAVLCAKFSSLDIMLKARRKVGVTVPVYCRAVTNSSRQLQDKNIISRWRMYQKLKQVYRQVDGVIAVSAGVARDVEMFAKGSKLQVEVANNPVITPQFYSLASESVSHPWFEPGQPPVITGVGRLCRAKNFPLLLEAYAQVRRSKECRLMLLGEGRQRKFLEKRARELGVISDVAMPGFVENPYPYLKRSSLFVLSSNWEGSPNVLTEALALGTPVVATDCPSGPRELLQNGRYGGLVPVENGGLLAEAMLEMLEAPPSRKALQSLVEGYTVENSARQYLQAMNISV